jgi:hypothetical protein
LDIAIRGIVDSIPAGLLRLLRLLMFRHLGPRKKTGNLVEAVKMSCLDGIANANVGGEKSASGFTDGLLICMHALWNR